MRYLKQFWNSIFLHSHNHKYINGTQGVIAIFLAILMVPFATIGGALVNAARVDSAVAIFDEALCNASNSTLGTYDSFLRKRFGLLAMAQAQDEWGGELTQEAVNKIIGETFDFYLEQNTKSLSNTYLSYDAEAKGEFPLANPSVLEYQIMEFGKYAVPTQMGIDAFSIDELFSKLEKMIPGYGWFSLISSTAGLVDKGIALGEHIEALKKALENEKVAIETYYSKYQTFYNAISKYFSLVSERDEKIAEINNMSDEEIDNRIEQIDERLTELDEEVAASGQTWAIQEEVEALDEEKTKISGWRNDRAGSIQKIEDEYEQKLNEQKAVIKTGKKEYSSSIKNVRDKLSATQKAFESVIADANGLVSAGINVAIDAGEGVSNFEKQKESKAEKELSDKIENSSNESEKANYQSQLETMKGQHSDAQATRNNASQINKAANAGISDVGQFINDSYKDFDIGIYNQISETLKTLKDSVDSYDTENIVSINWGEYYLSISGLLDSEKLKKIEEKLVGDIKESANWEVLSVLVEFVEALFKATVIFVPELNAKIDLEYYKDTYGGLPSGKDRNAHPLAMGEDGDREESQKYRILFGGANLASGGNDLSVNLLDLMRNIIEDFSVIGSEISTIMTFGAVGLLLVMTHLRELFNRAQSIISNFQTLIDNFKVTTLLKNVNQKLLVTGYGYYMTSNRLTYNGGKNLIGTSFNLRGQRPTTVSNSVIINSFSDLLNKSGNEEKQKCFVGAETEYLLCGFDSEFKNQSHTFLMIYCMRLIADIIPIAHNAELQAIASAISTATFGIGGPVLYILVGIVEPLIDTILIVNGGEVDLVKAYPYLAPSRLGDLISAWTKLKLSSDQVKSSKEKLQAKYDKSKVKYDISTETDSSGGGVGFKVDYSKILFISLLLGVRKDDLLGRMANIIEMESVENLSNTRGKSGSFDLDYAYTYVRSKASFTTNEFLPMSNSGGLRAKERIVYKGY